MKDIIISSLRFGLWATLAVHMYFGAANADKFIAGTILSICMFSWAVFIPLETIFRMNRKPEDVRKD